MPSDSLKTVIYGIVCYIWHKLQIDSERCLVKPLPELMSFLEGLSEPHILFDAQYRILAANAAYRQQFSPVQSVVGRTCYEVSHHFSVPCDQAGESCPLAQARESGQRERVTHLHHTTKGEEYINMFKRREIYRHLSNAAERMAHSANTLHDIIVKMC